MVESLSPGPIPMSELNRWCGISHLDPQYKENIKLAFVFNDVTALVTMDDDFYLHGKNEHGSLATASEVNFVTKIPTRIEALCGKRVSNFAFGVQKKIVGQKKTCLLSFFVLTEEGSVFAWGANDYGNLGLKFISAHPIPPTRVPLNAHVTQIACGASHSLALTASGEVYGFGRNFFGQVGSGNRQDHPFPVKITIGDGTKVVSVACGRSHSVVLTADGKVFTFGQNQHGQLGQNMVEEFCLVPTQIQFPKDAGTIIKIMCGKHHTLVLDHYGEVFSWGDNRSSQLGLSEDEDLEKSIVPLAITLEDSDRILDIAAVPHLSVSVCRSSTKVIMWGKFPEPSGKCIAPWETFMNSMPDVFSSYVMPAVTYRPISTASMHHYANIDVHPDIVKWSGLKFLHPTSLQDVQLAFVCGIGFEQTAMIVSGEKHEVFFCGKNVHGSLGTGLAHEFETRSPIKNKLLTGQDIIHVTFGLDVKGGVMCLFALTRTGSIFSWGYNEYGELGLGHVSEPTDAILPTKIEGALKNVKVTQLTCGSDHVLAITNKGELFSWGYDYFGQCGTGSSDGIVSSPARVKFRGSGTKVVAAAGGMFHSVAVVEDGNVYAWGKNDKNQCGVLGGGTKQESIAVPVRVKFPPGVKIDQICCGPDCTFGISSRKTLFFWGYCDFNKNIAMKPVRVCTDLGEIIDVGTAHWSSIYAIKTSVGRVFVWGNLRGQKNVVKSPLEIYKANSVADVFSIYSNPPAMIRPIVPRVGSIL